MIDKGRGDRKEMEWIALVNDLASPVAKEQIQQRRDKEQHVHLTMSNIKISVSAAHFKKKKLNENTHHQ
jgi:hypothetical protein